MFLGAIPTPTKLSEIRNRFELADLLKVTDSGLRALLYSSPRKNLYRVFRIQKKSGKTRTIRAPIPRLMNIQRRLLRLIEQEYDAKDVIHGFVKGRGIKTNANKHVGRREVLNVDLADFFPSINFGRVRGMFLAAPFNLPGDIATVLAQISCDGNELPQGAPTSPIISNMICRRLDVNLRRLAMKANCRYTRFADDLTFSAGRKGKLELLCRKINGSPELSDSLKAIIQKNGFEINYSKVRLQCVNHSQMVTGLITNVKVNVPRKFIRNIRAMLHNAERSGLSTCQKSYEERRKSIGALLIDSNGFLSLLRGRIDFVGAIRGRSDRIYLNLMSRLIALDSGAVSPRAIFEVRKQTDWRNTLLDSLWVIEGEKAGTIEVTQGTGVALTSGGILTCAHVCPPGYEISLRNRSGSVTDTAVVSVRCEKLDLALLSFQKTFEGALPLASAPANDGETVLLGGFPHFSNMNQGIVESGSVIGRKSGVDGDLRIIISTPILEGNSGGPVLNMSKEVVGIAAKGNERRTREYESNQPEAIDLTSVRDFLADAYTTDKKI